MILFLQPRSSVRFAFFSVAKSAPSFCSLSIVDWIGLSHKPWRLFSSYRIINVACRQGTRSPDWHFQAVPTCTASIIIRSANYIILVQSSWSLATNHLKFHPPRRPIASLDRLIERQCPETPAIFPSPNRLTSFNAPPLISINVPSAATFNRRALCSGRWRQVWKTRLYAGLMRRNFGTVNFSVSRFLFSLCRGLSKSLRA